jgi:hypothetical protein
MYGRRSILLARLAAKAAPLASRSYFFFGFAFDFFAAFLAAIIQVKETTY